MLNNLLSNVSLSRLNQDDQAGLLITSLPWPREAEPALSLGGRPTYTRPLGAWPGAQDCPRRLLMIADSGGSAPESIKLGDAAMPQGEPPTADDRVFAESEEPAFLWDRRMLRIEHSGRQVGLVMGLQTETGIHWWEACRLVEKQSSPTCRTVEMGGAIPLVTYGVDELEKHDGLTNPFLHKHNWINGHIEARMHSNGVCEIFAHHINAKYVDPGSDLENAVPVVGFWFGGSCPDVESLGEWDGSVERLEHEGVAFDLAEVARLATPDKPGKWSRDDDFVVLQPYMGMELFGGNCPKQRTGNPWIFEAKNKLIPQGMARTLRFSLSLSDRSPKVARYLAPEWWYGLCEEFGPDPLLPVTGPVEYVNSQARKWIRTCVVDRGFEDGCAARGGRRRSKTADERIEPGWEGEIPYGAFLAAWRSGEADLYDTAMRMAYHFTDIVIDHSMHLARMHGYPPPAISLPMQRLLGPLAAYLETGDDYLYETSQAVVENAFRVHRNSWPRLAMGRDACFIRGAVMLYRYFANDHFKRIAKEGALAVTQVQRPDGAFGDQGGGTGIHMRSGYVVKPWMGTLACSAMMDYLDYVDEDPVVQAAIGKYGDWLLRERHVAYETGERGWAYQHFYGDGRRHWVPHTDRWLDLPGASPWHQESMGRILLRCTRATGDGSYIDAWAESLAGRGDKTPAGDHGTSCVLQFLPMIEDHLWNATYEGGKINLQPVWFGDRTPREAEIHSPAGATTVAWKSSDELALPEGVSAAPIVYPVHEQPAAQNK